MVDDNIFTLIQGNKVEAESTDSPSREAENHFYLKTFLSYTDAVDYVDEVVNMYDLDEYFVGLQEVRNINHSFQAAVTIYKRQGELDL